MTTGLVAEYHDLLAAGDPAAEWAQLEAALQAQRLRFGTRPICNVLRPLFVDRARYQGVMTASRDFWGAIRTLYAWLMEDEALRARVGLSEAEEAALHIDPGFSSPDGIGRLDGFIDPSGTLRFVEYNADSPGGLGFGHALGELFLALPTMQRLSERYRFTTVPVLDDVRDTLLAHYRAWGGREPQPTIGIVDWEGVGTAREFELFRDHFRASGLGSVITFPDALAVRDGVLWDERSGERIDIVYKRVLVGELLARLGVDNVLTRAMRERAACVVNSYRVQLIFKKTIFALLSTLADDPRFPAAQRRALRRHLPWTRIVRDEAVDYEGRRVDLLPLLAEHPERFVLKPNGEYGGTGIVLGWESEPDEWAAALQRVLASDDPFVVQARIPLATEPFPLWRDGALRIEERFVDLDPYTHAPNRVRGAGVRLGTSGLLNVTAGGGSAVPVVIVEPTG